MKTFEQLEQINAELLAALRAVMADVKDIDNDSCLSFEVGKKCRHAISLAEGVEFKKPA